jgi:hypothetical protein
LVFNPIPFIHPSIYPSILSSIHSYILSSIHPSISLNFSKSKWISNPNVYIDLDGLCGTKCVLLSSVDYINLWICCSIPCDESYLHGLYICTCVHKYIFFLNVPIKGFFNFFNFHFFSYWKIGWTFPKKLAKLV